MTGTQHRGKHEAPPETETQLQRHALLIGTAAVAVALLVDFLWGAQLGWYPPADSATPTAAVTATPPASLPSLINDPSQPDWQIEGEWYCWNTGLLAPHHIGHRVLGDHLCTWGELRADGFAWTP